MENIKQKFSKYANKFALYTGAGLMAVSTALAAYTPNYTAGDIAPISIDFVGFVGVSFVDFAEILGLLLVFGIGWGLAKRIGK